MQQSSATQSLHLSFWGLRKIVACSHSSSQCLLVSTVFGTVSSLHPTSFLMIFTLVYASVSPDTVSLLNVSTRFYLGVHAVRNIATTVCMEAALGSTIAETANTRAFLRKGRDATTRLSQRRVRGSIRRQLAVRCAAQQQVRFNAHPINAVSLQNIATTVCGSLAWTALAWTANTRALLRKGRYDTTRLSQ